MFPYIYICVYIYIDVYMCIYACTYFKILATASGHRTRSLRHGEAETADETLAMAAMAAMPVMAATVGGLQLHGNRLLEHF